jgi:transcription elongation GreA/GreB family factor
MPDFAAQTIEKARPWRLTSRARSKLLEDIARMSAELVSLTGQGLEEGIVRLPVALTERRLETLKAVLAGAEIVEDADRAAIGRRATLCDDAGASTTYEIVLPGDGNPANGQVSADSPLGEAILSARPGDVVEVAAPAGRWSVTLVSVD